MKISDLRSTLNSYRDTSLLKIAAHLQLCEFASSQNGKIYIFPVNENMVIRYDVTGRISLRYSDGRPQVNLTSHEVSQIEPILKNVLFTAVFVNDKKIVRSNV